MSQYNATIEQFRELASNGSVAELKKLYTRLQALDAKQFEEDKPLLDEILRARSEGTSARTTVRVDSKRKASSIPDFQDNTFKLISGDSVLGYARPAPRSDLKFSSPEFIGMKREQQEVMTQFVRPVLYKNLLKRGKALLLYGPPGNGKTFLAKAIVNTFREELKNKDIFLFAPTSAELQGGRVGDTEKNIKTWFEAAQAMAAATARGQSILFFDEFETIGGSRQLEKNKNIGGAVTTLLQLMEGVAGYDRVTVLAATNLPWELDSAILRRFNASVMVDIPGDDSRRRLFVSEVDGIVKPDNWNPDSLDKNTERVFAKCAGLQDRKSEDEDCIRLAVNIEFLSGMSKKGIDRLYQALGQIGAQTGVDYKSEVERFLRDGGHSNIERGPYYPDNKPTGQSGLPTNSVFGYSSSDIAKFTRRALNFVGVQKLKKPYDLGANRSCYPVCPDDVPDCKKCNLTERQRNRFYLKVEDIKKCVVKITTLFKDTPSTVNTAEYIDNVVYKITRLSPLEEPWKSIRISLQQSQPNA